MPSDAFSARPYLKDVSIIFQNVFGVKFNTIDQSGITTLGVLYDQTSEEPLYFRTLDGNGLMPIPTTMVELIIRYRGVILDSPDLSTSNHPDILKFIEYFKSSQNLNEVKITQLRSEMAVSVERNRHKDHIKAD
ncbi:hypothetical protein RF11_04502 [Thelohanellus kitauei]|uniref:Uncharacterized protein n=1 Tax=Thelohanellus kitauei TaxID=669202 RepID=A0A0C2MBP0_THEKT|nr:hypothetical protein RF11_04502 [Thelohanellus kitauei]